jgi:mannosyltransferase OCH1-like enzyme
MYHAMKVWEEHFPSYSVFFHDDEAVERLLSMDWPEFPDFHRMLNCVVQGAMKIDIWRLVVLWRFGGMYTDNDMLPSSNFTDDTIHPEASFFSLSDGSDRPSQWLFASTPRHPVYNRTLPIITRKVLDIRNIAKPRVVFTTGPQVLFEGWQEVFGNTTRVGNNTNMLRSPDGLLVQRYWKHRDEYEQFLNRTYWGDEVPCNRKCSNRMHISRKERNQIDAGRVHWQKDTFQGTTGRPSVSCAQYLDSLQKTN